VRIFSVTGTSTAATTASRILTTSASFSSSAEPACTLQTFFAGQPMLMSMIWAPPATFSARLGEHLRSAPAICTETGPDSPAWSRRRRVLRDSRSSGRAETISETASAAPKRRARRRKGRSVIPAIGATNKPLRSA
jgi:hypothetical protein